MSIKSVQKESLQKESLQNAIGEVSHFLEEALQLFREDDAPQTRGRPRILPSLCLWAAMLVCLFRGEESQLALWRMIRHYGVFSYPPIHITYPPIHITYPPIHITYPPIHITYPPIHITDQAVYKRIETEGEAPLAALFAHVSALLQERLTPFIQQNQSKEQNQSKLAPFALAPFASEVIALDEMTLDQVQRTLPSALCQAHSAKPA